MIEMKFFLEKYKKVVLLIISILTVLTVLLNTTYSLLFKNDETEVQSYATGILEIESETTDNSITLTNAFPMSDSEGASLTPFTFNIKNNGTVNYKYDLKMLSTSLTNQINPDYIKIKVNDNEPVTLGVLNEGKVTTDQTISANSTETIDIRVWLAENTPNTEINKTFNAKVVIEGYANYKEESGGNPLTTLTNLGLSVREETPNFFNTSCSSGCNNTLVGVFAAEDDLGTSYYFRGDVTNNYVKFGKTSTNQDIFWRIVRINGDGSIRMIFDGTSDNYDTKIIGENYYKDGEVLNNYLYSYAKAAVDEFYSNNFENTSYESHIVDAIYCEDFEYYGTESGFDFMGLGGYMMGFGDDRGITLKCRQLDDRFSKYITVGEVQTNGELSYSIGLLTGDEMIMAGATYPAAPYQTYLESYNSFWTMSPSSYNWGSGEEQFVSMYVYNDGYFQESNVYQYKDIGDNGYHGIRPVITIRGDSLQYGSGSSTDPFRIEEGNNSGSVESPVYSFTGIAYEYDSLSLTINFTTTSNGTLYFEPSASQNGSESLEISVNNLYSEIHSTDNWDFRPVTLNLNANTSYSLVVNFEGNDFGGEVSINNITFTGVDASSISITKSDGWTQN